MAKAFRKRTHTTNFSSTIVTQLGALQTEVDKQELIRKSVAVGAKQLYDLLLTKVPVEEGLLKKSVYHYWNKGRAQSTYGAQQFYSIGVNMKKAPHWHLVEFGHKRINVVFKRNGVWIGTKTRLQAPKWVPAVPYLRPTWLAGEQAAVVTVRERLKADLRTLTRNMKSGAKQPK